MTLLTQQSFLELIADLEKTAEARVHAPSNQNKGVGDLMRLQAGNADGHGSQHIWVRIRRRTIYDGASAMLARQENRDKLLGNGTTMIDGLRAYCLLATNRYTSLDISPADNITLQKSATRLMGRGHRPQWKARKEYWLRMHGIRPRTYGEADMDKELRLVMATGVIGRTRDTVAARIRPNAVRWDECFTAHPDMKFVVWDIVPEVIHLSTRPIMDP
jgi:ASC-1-like (ASCH) protein